MPWVIFVVSLCFTFVFWLIVIWMIPGHSLTEIYRFWVVPGYPGLSVFSVSTFIILLLIYLLIIESVLARRSRKRFALVLCLLSALPLATVGGFLVELAHMSSAFSWRHPDSIDEPIDPKGEFLGRVMSVNDEGSTRYLQVVLEDGAKVVVAAVPRFADSSESDYVWIQRLAGRQTHTLCYRLNSYFPKEWLGLSTERALRSLE